MMGSMHGRGACMVEVYMVMRGMHGDGGVVVGVCMAGGLAWWREVCRRDGH